MKSEQSGLRYVFQFAKALKMTFALPGGHIEPSYHPNGPWLGIHVGGIRVSSLAAHRFSTG